MNSALTVELQFFLVSIISGGILLAVYDVFRILRRVIKHNSGWIAFEDLIFWVGASLFIFAMLYKENDGIIRGFAIMGMAIGMLLYHFMISDLIVNLVVKLIQALISPFVFVLKKVKKFIGFLWIRGRKVLNNITRRLKKWTKSVRIMLDKRKQKTKDKKDKRAKEIAKKALHKHKTINNKTTDKKSGKQTGKKSDKKSSDQVNRETSGKKRRESHVNKSSH